MVTCGKVGVSNVTSPGTANFAEPGQWVLRQSDYMELLVVTESSSTICECPHFRPDHSIGVFVSQYRIMRNRLPNHWAPLPLSYFEVILCAGLVLHWVKRCQFCVNGKHEALTSNSLSHVAYHSGGRIYFNKSYYNKSQRCVGNWVTDCKRGTSRAQLTSNSSPVSCVPFASGSDQCLLFGHPRWSFGGRSVARLRAVLNFGGSQIVQIPKRRKLCVAMHSYDLGGFEMPKLREVEQFKLQIQIHGVLWVRFMYGVMPYISSQLRTAKTAKFGSLSMYYSYSSYTIQ